MTAASDASKQSTALQSALAGHKNGKDKDHLTGTNHKLVKDLEYEKDEKDRTAFEGEIVKGRGALRRAKSTATARIVVVLVAVALAVLPATTWLPDISIKDSEIDQTFVAATNQNSHSPIANEKLSAVVVDDNGQKTTVSFQLSVGDEDLNIILVISPQDSSPPAGRSTQAAVAALEQNHDKVHQLLLVYGAVLFRGFTINTPNEFEQVSHAFHNDLDVAYLGTSPRSPVDGTSHVFTASEFASWKPVPSHCEMSFMPSPPRYLMFFANHKNPGVGGQTPVIDYLGVWQKLLPEVKHTFTHKGIGYIRRYPSQSKIHTVWDPFKTKPWETMFNTEDKEQVRQQAATNNFDVEWDSDETLVITNNGTATRQNPDTHQQLWHNHFTVLHSRSWADEFAFAATKQNSLKYTLLYHIFTIADTIAHLSNYARTGLGQHVTHATGEEINKGTSWYIRRMVWKHTSVKDWQEKDVLVIDNFRLAHARMPFDHGPRSILAAWSKA